MLGVNEFLAQVVPLFLQFVGIPVALGIAYFAYQKYYKPRKETSNEPELTNNSVSKNQAHVDNSSDPDTIPNATFTVKSHTSKDDTEDKSMTDQNQQTPEQDKPSRRPKVDTSDLPPLDMLIGALDDQPDETPATDEPAQVVQLKTLSPDTEYVQLNTGQIAPAQEVISILRDKDDGKLIIQVGSTAYRTLADDTAIKQLFTQIMKELAGTITKPDDNPPARKRYVVGEPETKPTPPSRTRSSQPATPAMPSIRDLLVEDEDDEPVPAEPKPRPKSKTTAPPPPNKDGIMPGDLPSYKLEDNPLKSEKKGRFGGQKIEAEPLPELDLAGAIETYLQYKLQHTPDYIGRDIHIHGTPTGAIRIQVDENYYDFVDEVADAEVREFLQETIAEWQDRQ